MEIPARPSGFGRRGVCLSRTGNSRVPNLSPLRSGGRVQSRAVTESSGQQHNSNRKRPHRCNCALQSEVNYRRIGDEWPIGAVAKPSLADRSNPSLVGHECACKMDTPRYSLVGSALVTDFDGNCGTETTLNQQHCNGLAGVNWKIAKEKAALTARWAVTYFGSRESWCRMAH
jgi:hypothetical protein